MVKINKRKSRKLLQLKRLSEQVPISKYQKYQDEELKLYETQDQDSIIKEKITTKQEESDLNTSDENVWQDEHDEQIDIDISKIAKLRKFMKDGEKIISGKEYNKRLRQFYNQQQSSFYGWAQKKSNDNNNNNNLPQEYEIVEQMTSSILQPKIIKIEQAGLIKKQINSVIQSISFHPKIPIFAVGSLDKTLRIYTINPNKTIQIIKNIAIDKFPINNVQFMSNGEIIVSSNFKSHLLCIDYQTQKIVRIRSTLIGTYNKQIQFSLNNKYIAIFNDSGIIQLHGIISKVFCFQFKQNEPCNAVTFGNEILISGGKGGKIYVWSLKSREIIDVFHNPGGWEVNCLDMKLDLLAVGCKTGIVNIFRFDNNKFVFQKEIQNLTTSIDQVHFNEFAEMLCFSSKWKDSAFRILHVDTMTVFENWPKKNDALKKVSAVGLSVDSRFLVIGNEEGDLKCYRLLHY